MRTRKAVLIPLLIILASSLLTFGIMLYSDRQKRDYYEIFAIFPSEIYVKERNGDPNEWQTAYTIYPETVIQNRKGAALVFDDLQVGQLVKVQVESNPAFILADYRRIAVEVTVFQ